MDKLIFLYVPEHSGEEEAIKEYDDFTSFTGEQMESCAEAYRKAGYKF